MQLIGVIMDREKIQHHIKHLQKKHDELDILIQEEFNRYQDDRAVINLKKEKLILKEEIEKFKKDLEIL
jgi:hypothetical protein